MYIQLLTWLTCKIIQVVNATTTQLKTTKDLKAQLQVFFLYEVVNSQKNEKVFLLRRNLRVSSDLHDVSVVASAACVVFSADIVCDVIASPS